MTDTLRDLATVTIETRTIRVPPSGVVRLPGPYPHRFASLPLYWREVADVRAKWLAYPVLSPEKQPERFR